MRGACLVFFLTVSVLVSGAFSAVAQTATLIVNNNTNATLRVETVNIHDPNVHSGSILIAPNTAGSLTVPMGQSNIVLQAVRMKEKPIHEIRYSFLHSGRHEVGVFPEQFGFFAMFDKPGTGNGDGSEGGAGLADDNRPQPSLAELATLEALNLHTVEPGTRDCGPGGLAPLYYLIDYVSNCPASFITRGKDPPGQNVRRWCAYCGAGYESRLDRHRCCVKKE